MPSDIKMVFHSSTNPVVLYQQLRCFESVCGAICFGGLYKIITSLYFAYFSVKAVKSQFS